MTGKILALFVATLGLAGVARAQLVVLDSFDPAELGGLVSAGLDTSQDRVWAYDSFGAQLGSYTLDGTPAGSIPRAGEAADDMDIDFATTAFTLDETNVPAGSLLLTNGETDGAEVYALDPSDGSIIATLATDFGNDHVVGGAWHPTRGTLFLVADRNDSVSPSIVAEIDPATGAVLNSFGTASADFTVNYGDLDVHVGTGNLFLVSSDESVIRELSPVGALVQDVPLPPGVPGLSGIALDEAANELWVSGTNGTVYRLGAAPPTTTSTTSSTTSSTSTSASSSSSTSTSTTSTTSTTGSSTTSSSTTSSTSSSNSTSSSTSTSVVTTSTTSTSVPPAACELLTGKKLFLATNVQKGKSRLNVVSKDPAITLGLGNDSADDPVLHGATLRVVSTDGGFDDTYVLAAERWQYRKRAGENLGYRLKKTKPFGTLLIQPAKHVKIAANGDGLGHTLATNPDPVDVVLTIGGHCYCLRFAGTPTFKEGKRFLAEDAPAPTGCPAPAPD